MARSPIVTSAKVKLFVNGKPFGRVSAFQWSSETPKRELHGIDDLLPFELAASAVRMQGSMTIYRLSGDGGAEGAGLVAPISELQREQYVSLSLVEIGTGFVLFEARQCSVTSQSWSAASRGQIMGSINFQIMAWGNEVAS